MKSIDSATRLIATDRVPQALRSSTLAPVSEESRTESGDRYTPSEQPESQVYSYRDLARFKGGAQDNDARDGQVKDLIATGPGARGEVQRGDHDDAALEDPNAGKKDTGLPGFDLGSVRGHAAESKKSVEGLLSIGGEEPVSARDRLPGSGGAASDTGISEGGGGAAQGGGSGVTGAGSDLSFNPIRDAQRGQEGSGKEPGEGGPSIENQASDQAFNRKLAEAAKGSDKTNLYVGADGFSRYGKDSNQVVTKVGDSVVTETAEKGGDHVRQVDSYDKDGKKSTTTTRTHKNPDGSVTETVTTTTTTPAPKTTPPPSEPSTDQPAPPADSSTTPGVKDPGPDGYQEHGFIHRSGESPTGKGQEGGEVDPIVGEAAFEVAAGAELPDMRDRLLGGDVAEPGVGSGEPGGEAPTGSGFNDPGALDPVDDEAVVPQTEGRERELGGHLQRDPQTFRGRRCFHHRHRLSPPRHAGRLRAAAPQRPDLRTPRLALHRRPVPRAAGSPRIADEPARS